MILSCLNVHVQKKKFSVRPEFLSALASTWNPFIEKEATASLQHPLDFIDWSTLWHLAGSPALFAQTADKQS